MQLQQYSLQGQTCRNIVACSTDKQKLIEIMYLYMCLNEVTLTLKSQMWLQTNQPNILLKL